MKIVLYTTVLIGTLVAQVAFAVEQAPLKTINARSTTSEQTLSKMPEQVNVGMCQKSNWDEILKKRKLIVWKKVDPTRTYNAFVGQDFKESEIELNANTFYLYKFLGTIHNSFCYERVFLQNHRVEHFNEYEFFHDKTSYLNLRNDAEEFIRLKLDRKTHIFPAVNGCAPPKKIDIWKLDGKAYFNIGIPSLFAVFQFNKDAVKYVCTYSTGRF
jgi:hypothetical protein